MKISFLLLLLVYPGMYVCAQDDVSTAKWMLHPVIVDGRSNEWGSLNFYDDQTQLNFGIANDSNTIYLCFQTTTDPSQSKLTRAGMKVTLITKGKDKREATILFPLPQNKQVVSAVIPQDDSSAAVHGVFNKETFRQNYIAHHSTMHVSGFATVSGEVSTKDSLIQAAVNWDSASNFICEIAIAKKEFFGKNYIAKEAMESITLGVEVNALPKSESPGEGRNPVYKTGGTHGGEIKGEGRPDGMRTNGNGFNGGGKYQHPVTDPMTNENKISLSKKSSFKQKFVLSSGSN